MRHTCFSLTALAAFAALSLSATCRAQWSDGGWTPTISSHSPSGYVVNTQTPGASSVAPSAGHYTTWVEASYSNTMSANGANYSVSIAWTYSMSGSTSGYGGCLSSFGWDRGTMSDSRSGNNVSYSDGPTKESGSDTVISPPGGPVSVQITAHTSAQTSPPGSSASAGASGNGSYTP